MISNHPSNDNSKKNKVYIPLRFWFNNNIGCALPLIALQYNDIKLEIKLADKNDANKYCENTTDNIIDTQDTSLNINQIQLLCEFIHLDSEERRLFASKSHEYLITQLQTSLHNPINLYKTESQEAYEKIQHKTQLRFNHPIKELIWTFQDSSSLIYKTGSHLEKYKNVGILSTNYWRGFKVGDDHLIGANLVLNGKDMTEELPASFYRNVQHYQYHNGCNLKNIRDINKEINPAITPGNEYTNYSKGSGIYSYSLCLSPEDSQPSGSLNFSNLESAELKFRLFKKLPFSNYSVTVSSNEAEDINAWTGQKNFNNFNGLNLNDTVLLTNQANNSENGVYKVAEGNGAGALKLERDPDFNTLLINSPVLVKVINGAGSGPADPGNQNRTFIVSLKHGLTSVVGDIKVTEYYDENNNPVLFDLESKILTIYAVNYNVLRIMSGMSSILFSS